MSTFSLVSKAATGFLTGLLGSFTNKGLTFLLQVIVSRIYGPGYYGFFVTGLLIVHIMQTLSSLGVQKGGMRFLAIAHENADSVAMRSIFQFSVMVPLCFGLVVGISSYFLAPVIASSCFKNPQLEATIRLFSFSIPFFALLRTAADLTRAFKTAKYAVIVEDLLFPIINILAFLCLHSFGYGFFSAIQSFILANVVCSLVITIMGFNLLRHFSGHEPGGEKFEIQTHGLWRQILQFSLPLLPMGLLLIVNSSVDIIMLNMFTSASEVGKYAAAARLVMLFALITLPMKLIFAPMIASQHGKNGGGKAEMLYKTSCRWMLFLNLPVFTLLLIAREPLMMIFGQEYAASGPVVLGFLLIGALFASFAGVAGDMLTMTGNQHLELACMSGGLALNIYLNLLIIPRYGVIGAAIATMVSSIVTDFSRIVIIALRYRIHPFSMKFVFPLTIALFVFSGDALLRSLFHINWIGRSFLAVIGTAAVIIGTVTKGLMPDDQRLFVLFKEKFGKAN